MDCMDFKHVSRFVGILCFLFFISFLDFRRLSWYTQFLGLLGFSASAWFRGFLGFLDFPYCQDGMNFVGCNYFLDLWDCLSFDDFLGVSDFVEFFDLLDIFCVVDLQAFPMFRKSTISRNKFAMWHDSW